jgi:retron-type reverse transcriptase
MPKTFNGLWDEFVSFENLYAAYTTARSGGHREDMQVMQFTRNLETNLFNIQNHLMWGTWKPSPVNAFIVYEPKKRLIQAPAFVDRIVHHAFDQVAGHLFEKKMVSQTYACLEDRGPLKAVLQMQEYIQSYPHGQRLYAIKGDVHHFFPSINHDFLKRQIRRTISDKRLLCVADLIIDQNEQLEGLYIGSLPSQLFAGVTLTPFDHHMKDDLGIKHYVRYMDDFIIISDNLAYLRELLKDAERQLNSAGLQINPKSKVIPITHGIDFCGYRTFNDHLLPRKRNVKNARRRILHLIDEYDNGNVELEKVRASIMSFLGYVSHCSAYRTTERLLGEALINARPLLKNKEVV